MKLEGPDCLRLSSINFDHEGQAFILWYNVLGGVSEHMNEILSTKVLIERLLREYDEIPKEYNITIGFATMGDTIIFCNWTSNNVAEVAGGPITGEYQLFDIVIHVPCDLSELSVLKDVKYLHLLYGTKINGITGLENINGLLYISLTGSPYKVPPDKTFTEEEQQAIKKMYPDCYISCYPVDTD